MTKKEYWEAHVKKNPKLADETCQIKMSVEMLHKLLDEAYDKGFQASSKTKSLADILGDMSKVTGVDMNKFKKEGA